MSAGPLASEREGRLVVALSWLASGNLIEAEAAVRGSPDEDLVRAVCVYQYDTVRRLMAVEDAFEELGGDLDDLDSVFSG